MDPFIEASRLWEDFHHDLISEIKHFLASRLPERYVVRTGERSYVALAMEDGPHSVLPDVAVAAKGRSRGARRSKENTAVAEKNANGPVIMQAMVKAQYRESFLEIRQVDPEHRLVTGIEILSPANKRQKTKGWRLYYRKRQAFLSGYANFVELDLLRRGKRMPMVSNWPDSPYDLLVCRKKEAPRCSVWPGYFTKPLPPIPIPLAPPDGDISLSIQPLIETIYARSRYEQDIDYRKPLIPPLSPADSAWLDKRLRQARE
jgi:hypothetical protein